MKIKLKSLNILLGLGVLALVSGYSTAVKAQYQVNDDPGYQSNEKDSLTGDGITGINPLELIHRANLSNGISAEEFNQNSAGRIQDSASSFKLLQQQKILEQYKAQPAESTTESISE